MTQSVCKYCAPLLNKPDGNTGRLVPFGIRDGDMRVSFSSWPYYAISASLPVLFSENTQKALRNITDLGLFPAHFQKSLQQIEETLNASTR